MDTDSSWNKAMQRVHSATITITRHVSLLILAIIYYRSIHSCVHTTVLRRVEDTKHLSEHKACMRRGQDNSNRKEQEGQEVSCTPKATLNIFLSHFELGHLKGPKTLLQHEQF